MIKSLPRTHTATEALGRCWSVAYRDRCHCATSRYRGCIILLSTKQGGIIGLSLVLCILSECMSNSCLAHMSTEVDSRLRAIFWGTCHQRIFWWWQGAFFPARWSSKEHVETPNLLTSWNAGFYAASTLLAKLHVDHVVVRVPHPIRLCALGLLFYKSKQKRGWIGLDSSMSSRLNIIMCAGGSSALYLRLRMLQNLCTV